MAGETPQIQDAQPILNPVKPADKSEGYDEFAKVLGSLAKTTGDKVAEIEADKSESMLMGSVANVESIKTSAHERMLENPGQATKISEQTTQALDMVKSASFVNSKDRAKLDSVISGAKDNVELRATATNVQQSQRAVGLALYTQLPEQLKAYQDALISDPKLAQGLHDALIGSVKNAVMIGGISPEQGGTVVKQMTKVVEGVSNLHALSQNNDANSVDYHTAKSSPLNNSATDTQAPIDQGTKWLTDYYQSDHSFRGVQNSIAERKMPNTHDYLNLTNAQQLEVNEQYRGISRADGLIYSGQPQPTLVRRYNELSSKGAHLSTSEQAERDALHVHLKEAAAGNMDAVMQRDPQANAISENFIKNNEAIKESPILTPQQKNDALNDNDNKYTYSKLSWAQARHYPDDQIQPISQAKLGAIDASFQFKGNPDNAINTLNTMPKDLRGWAANAQKDPIKQMVVQGISYASPNITHEQKSDFIIANQQGTLGALKETNARVGAEEGEKKASDATLNQLAFNALSPQMKMLGQTLSAQDADKQQKGMYISTANYAKFIAQKNLDPTHPEKYIPEAAKIFQDSHMVLSNTNYVVNPQQLNNPIPPSQFDQLASYAVAQGQAYLRGANHPDIEDNLAAKPLYMIITPNNYVKAVDATGNVYFSEPFTTGSIGKAMKFNNENKKVQSKKEENMLAGQAAGAGALPL